MYEILDEYLYLDKGTGSIHSDSTVCHMLNMIRIDNENTGSGVFVSEAVGKSNLKDEDNHMDLMHILKRVKIVALMQWQGVDLPPYV